MADPVLVSRVFSLTANLLLMKKEVRWINFRELKRLIVALSKSPKNREADDAPS